MKKVPIEEIRERATFKTLDAITTSDNLSIAIANEKGFHVAHINSYAETHGDGAHEINAQLITHCLNTHQMLLDALKYADNLLRDRYDHNSPCIIETIEAASFVEVEK